MLKNLLSETCIRVLEQVSLLSCKSFFSGTSFLHRTEHSSIWRMYVTEIARFDWSTVFLAGAI